MLSFDFHPSVCSSARTSGQREREEENCSWRRPGSPHLDAAPAGEVKGARRPRSTGSPRAEAAQPDAGRMPADPWPGAQPGARSCPCGCSGAPPARSGRAGTPRFPRTLRGAPRPAHRTRPGPARRAGRPPLRHAELGSSAPSRGSACPATATGTPTSAWTALASACTVCGTRQESTVRNA